MDKSFLKSIKKPALETTRRDYKPMLIIGLVVMFFSIAVRTVLSLTGLYAETQDLLHEDLHKLYDNGIVFFFFYTCLLVPLIEEFSYRSWTTGKRWVFWLSWVCMTVFMLFSKQWIVAASASMAVLAIGLLVKNQKRQMWHLAVATSLAFAMAHNGGFSTLDAVAVFTMMQLCGVALINCYLGLRWHWLVGVGVHAGMNILAMFALVASFQPKNVETTSFAIISSDGYRCGLAEGISEYENTEDENYFLGKGTLTEIYAQLLSVRYQIGMKDSPKEDTVFLVETPSSDLYTYWVNAGDKAFDCDWAVENYLDILEGQGWHLRLDTIRQDDKVCVTVREEN